MKLFFLTLVLCFSFFSQYIPYNNRIIKGKKAAVVCSSPEAAQIGIDILKQGGNAFDASVAVAFAMAVTYPQAGNIGGGGFLVGFSEKDGEFTLDYREKAPLSASKDMYLDKDKNPVENMSTETHAASGVPGTVMGFWKLHQKYGKLTWEKLLKPSINLAENGFPLSDYVAYSMNSSKDYLKTHSQTKSIYYKESGFKSGDLFVQKDLAKTLKRISSNGINDFYNGETAKLLLKEMNKGNGFISKKDLETYAVKFRKPVSFEFNGHQVISMPLPSSGGLALFGILKSLETFDVKNYPYGSAKYVQLFTEICRQVYADRSEFLGDPDFEDIPLNKLFSKEYISKIVSSIQFKDNHSTSKKTKPFKSFMYESDETTHFSIIDEYGNAVSNTYTLNNSFGSAIVVSGAGFILNNQMDDFSIKAGVPNLYGLVGNEKNSIKPEKRMLSSMTPTIVLKNGKPFFIVGSPGGSQIITVVAQAIHRLISYEMDVDMAVNLPRIHHQWLPDVIKFEYGAISHDSQSILKSYNYELVPKTIIGDCHGILLTPNGVEVGISSRGNGAGKAY